MADNILYLGVHHACYNDYVCSALCRRFTNVPYYCRYYHVIGIPLGKIPDPLRASQDPDFPKGCPRFPYMTVFRQVITRAEFL